MCGQFLSLAAVSNNTYRIHFSIDSVARVASLCTTMNTSSDLETVDVSWISWVNCSFRMKAINPRLGSDTWHNIIYIRRKITSNHLLQLKIGENCSMRPFYHVGVTSAWYVYQKIVIFMILYPNFDIFYDSAHEFWRMITWWEPCHPYTLLLLAYLKGGTPILRHGRKILQWWPPFLWLSIRFGPYCMVQPDPIDPLFLQKKISLCLSYLVLEIRGHKIGLI